MKCILLAGIAGLSLIGAVHAEGLYYAGAESKESIPLKWSVGANLIYDDNVNPTATALTGSGSGTSVNPYVGVSFLSTAPQTTCEVFARLGMIYYLDKPSAGGTKDLYGQARLEASITHRFNERLRFVSRNFLSYELEPDYAYGYASGRQASAPFYWQTDNALGYRWTERLATYTGITLSSINYDKAVQNADRFTATLYHQFRYQLSPQTVLTADYRYSKTTGDALASDATDHYLLAGIEHRFSPTTILIARAGTQFHQVDAVGSSDTTSPFFELNLSSQINSEFKVSAFLRYGLENNDTVRAVGFPGQLYEFSSRGTLRVGVKADYAISQKLSILAGVDYIPASFKDGRKVADDGDPLTPVAPATASGLSEDVINAYIGLSLKFTDTISGDLTYDFTESTSDLLDNTYNRNRVSVGIRAEF